MILNSENWSLKTEKRGRYKHTSNKQDVFITRIVKTNSRQLKNEIQMSIATSYIRKRLMSANLKARSRRKVPLLRSVHIKRILDIDRKLVDESLSGYSVCLL